MADDKKNVPEVENPGEAPVKADPPAPDKPGPEPVLTEEETANLTHEGQAALFEMGEFIPDPGDKGIPPVEAPVVDTPPKEAPTAGKVVDLAAARDEAEKTKAPAKDAPAPDKADKKAAKTQGPDKPRRGRPAKADKAAPDKADPPKRDKMELLTKRLRNPWECGKIEEKTRGAVECS